MAKGSRIIIVIFLMVAAVLAGALVWVKSIDSEKLRSYVVDALSDNTGRKIKINGPVAFSIGLDGVKLSAQNVSISNADWAKAPVMAIVGRFDLGVNVFSALSGRLLVDEIVLENADISLEVDASGRKNWDMRSSGNAKPADKVEKAAAGKAFPVAIREVSVSNSQISVRGESGKSDHYNIAKMAMRMRGVGTDISYNGDISGIAINISANTNITDLFALDEFDFSVDGAVGSNVLAVQGHAGLIKKKADIKSCTISSGRSTVTCALSASWGDRLAISGNISGETVHWVDFMGNSDVSQDDDVAASSTLAYQNKKVFSAEKLPVDALRSLSLDVGIKLEKLIIGDGSLENVSGKVTSGGGAVNSAIRMEIGGVPATANLRFAVDRSPPVAEVSVKMDGANMADLQKLLGAPAFMSGKTGVDISLSGEGDNLHDIAATSSGVANITAGKGTILKGAAAKVSVALSALFGGTGKDSALNCMAARFIVRNGVVSDNGILMDTAASTVLGGGSINLNNETVNMAFKASTKPVNVGGALPSLRIGGTIAKPEYSADAVGAVMGVFSSLSGGNLGALSSSVVDMQVDPSGKNDCIYTLDNPKKKQDNSVLPANPLDRAGKKLKDLGDALFGGH